MNEKVQQFTWKRKDESQANRIGLIIPNNRTSNIYIHAQLYRQQFCILIICVFVYLFKRGRQKKKKDRILKNK